MAGGEAVPKLFSPEEADRLIPEIRRSLGLLRALRDRVAEAERKKAVEELAWLRVDGTVSPHAAEEIQRLERLQRESAKTFKAQLLRLERLGVHLKDLDEGLVDFFTARGEELVYLCWKEGEERIRFWHGLEAGFAGRRPLEEL